jgi:lipid-binding SYLF domain-containing protein
MARWTAVMTVLALVMAPRAAAQDQVDYELEKKQIDVAQAIEQMTKEDPGVQRFFDESYGYVVFPSVGKGGFIVGGAHGNGLVYEQGALVGKAELTQASIGLQAGGQSYVEVIFFEGKEDLHRFKTEDFEFSGQVSAVALNKGASADIDYSNGVAVVTKTKGGLMAEASLGGQKFDYTPIGN